MNLAWTGFFTRLNAANEAYAQYGDGNLAAVWVTGNDRNVAVVAGQLSTASEPVALFFAFAEVFDSGQVREPDVWPTYVAPIYPSFRSLPPGGRAPPLHT